MYLFLLEALAFIIGIVIFLLGLIVYYRDRKSSTNKAFFAMMLAGCGLVFTTIVIEFTLQEDFLIYNAVKLSYSSSILMGMFYLRLCGAFPKKEYKSPLWEKIIYLFSFAVIYVLLFTNWVFTGVREYKVGEIFLMPAKKGVTSNQLAYTLSNLWLVALLAIGIAILISKIKKAKGVERLQLQYLLLGTGIFSLYGLLVGPVATFLTQSPFMAYLNPYGLIFLFLFFSYAIVKHRLLDLRLIILKSLVYSFLVLAIASVYILSLTFLIYPLSSSLKISLNVILVLFGFLIAFGFPPFKRLVEEITNNIFYKGRYNPQKLLEEIGEIVNSTIDLSALTSLTLGKLMRDMKIKGAAYILRNTKENQIKEIGFRNLYLSKSILEKAAKETLFTDNIEENSKEKQSLRKQGIALVAPLLMEDRTIGYLVLGEKKSGDMYTSEDLDFLEILAHQLGVSLNSAYLYEDVLEDKRRIEKLLEEQKKLDKMKSEFISITTHEVNTPLAANEGYLSLVLSGRAGKISPEAKVCLKNAYDASRKTYYLLRRMMEASQLEQGELPVNIEPVQLSSHIKGIVKKYLPTARRKKIALIYREGRKIPKVLADKSLMEEVINELVENALKFTESGSIIISTQAKEGKVNFSISDTGYGIPESRLPHIFDKFYQVDTSFTRPVGGTGIGLYVVKLLLALHKEKIAVSSKMGHGTEFSFSLPTAK